MRFAALATDYDGTIASDGRVSDTTRAALLALRKSGRKLILVTGRELDDLFAVFPHRDVFDRIVAENGALLYDPAQHQTRSLGAAPPLLLIDTLRRREVPISVGRSVIATVKPFEHIVLSAIRDLGVEWHVIFNKDSVMALPSGITKATGLAPALAELKLSPEQTVGVGDAENDHAFLRLCGLGAAVANALPSLKNTADVVLSEPAGAGVVQLIDRLLTDDLNGVERKPRAKHQQES